MNMLKKTLLCVFVFLAGLSASSIKKSEFVSDETIHFMNEYDETRTVLCDKGKCGNDCWYTVDNKGVLTIGATGNMKDYSIGDFPEWYKEYSGFIKEVVILDGVKNIGDYAFYGLNNLEKIYIPKTITNIAKDSFITCKDFCICAGKDSYAKTYANNNNIKYERTIDMEISATNLKMYLDESTKLSCDYEKKDIKPSEKLEWFSDDEDILVVSNDGTITPKKDGIANVSAKIGNVSTTCKVEIEKYDIASADITFNEEKYVYDGKEKTPKIQIKKDGKLLENGKDYQVKYINNIQAGEACLVAEAKDNYTGKIEKTFLIKPAKVSFTTVSSSSTESIYLDWEKNGEVENYSIYRSDKKDGKFEKIDSSNDGSAVSYEDKELTKGKKYYYKIVGNVIYNNELVEGEESDVKMVIPTIQRPKLDYVSNVTSKDITIKWEAIKDAKGYIVYRKDDKGQDKYKQIAKVDKDKLSYKDSDVKKGIVYRYTIRAFDEEVEGEFDDEGVLASLVDKAKPKSIKATDDSITFEWEKQDDVDGYYVYRKTKSLKAFNNLKSFDKDETKIVDKSVEGETDYQYTVAAYVRHGKCISLGEKDAKGLNEKSLIQPSYSIGLPTESSSSCYVVALNFTNTSKRPIKILSNDAAMSDKDNPEFNRKLNLIDTKKYEDDKSLERIDSIDVEPKETVCLMFTVDDYATYYNSKSIVWFRFKYNDIEYVNKSSSDNQVSFFVYDKDKEKEQD